LLGLLLLLRGRKQPRRSLGESAEPKGQLRKEANDYRELGYSILTSALPSNVAATMLESFESDLPLWAADCGLSVETYLGVVNKWSHWNSRVASMVEQLGPLLRPRVEEILQSSAWPVGATIFRKSAHASRGTHAHQDLSYAWRPGSQLFSCTTWVALTPASASPLQVLPASHKQGVQAAVDFLDPDFVDKASSKEWKEAVTIQVDAGDAVLFDSRLWHSAEACVGGLRVALAITWATPAGPDGAAPGEYPRWPMSALPPPATVPKSGFGMDTVGGQLKAALRALLDADAESHTSAAELVHAVLASKALETLPDPPEAERLLRKFLDMRKAVLRHGAAGQNGQLFESLYKALILPQELRGPRSLEGELEGAEETSEGVQEMKVWMRKWAERSWQWLSLDLKLLQEASRWSDLDLCVLSHGQDVLQMLSAALEADCLQGHGLCFSKPSEEKLTVFIPRGNDVVRMDCFVTNDLSTVDVLATSAKSLLYAQDADILRHCGQEKPLSLVLRGLVIRFVESFENALAQMLSHDAYRAYFQMFIVFDSLVKLLYILDGGRQFLHLPKHAFKACSSEARRSLTSLVPNIRMEWLLEEDDPFFFAAYLHQFQKFAKTAQRIPDLSSALQCSMGPSDLPRSIETMHRLLQRTAIRQFHKGLYLCIGDGVPHAAKTVLDLQECGADLNHVRSVPLPETPGGDDCQAFGLFLRALLLAEFPVCLRCQDGRRTAAAAALLQILTHPKQRADSWLCGILEAVDMLHLLPPALRKRTSCNLPVELALGSGLTLEEFAKLRSKLTGVPEQLPAIQFHLKPGCPEVPCREYTKAEAELLTRCLLGKPSRSKPRAVFVTGLPGAGKTSCLEGLLSDLGMALNETVNLDADGARCFHAQHQRYAQQICEVDSNEALHFTSLVDLPSWFHNSDMKKVLYEAPDSVLSQLLQKRCDFVLPGIFDEPSTLRFMEDVLKENYQVHLLGIHVTADTATQRAEMRASSTGRMSCDLGREVGMLEQFPKLAACALRSGGIVALYDNDAGAKAAPVPKLVYKNGLLNCKAAAVCARWGLA
ncbi:unnamed protein product, partial [Effrenium voratum]